ncbi:sodium channel protein Nach-like [Sitophilus oryzae]|uniref:Sodium channel protein Nach-like n=1 Tax=Sitophilus oryzae TaxID=7048 RepID=A0A6J2X9P3_SITOR|nr:sodium channel protein Nach-like [Sitophilus oryzae]
MRGGFHNSIISTPSCLVYFSRTPSSFSGRILPTPDLQLPISSSHHIISRKTDIPVSDVDEFFESFIYLLNNDKEYDYNNKDNEILESILKVENKTIEKSVAPSCSDFLKRCIWKGNEDRCKQLFTQTKTANGYCCSFNYIQYKLYAKELQEPKRVSGVGYQSGLEVLLDNNPDDYFVTDISSVGYRILIHLSEDFPDVASSNILCSIETNTLIGITPLIVSASSGLRRMPLYQRNCLFPDERRMTFFPFYNFHNCLVDHNAKITYEKCGCIPFYIPNRETKKKWRVCTPKDALCVTQYEDLYETNKENVSSYDCPEDCETVRYSTACYQGSFDVHFTNRFGM